MKVRVRLFDHSISNLQFGKPTYKCFSKFYNLTHTLFFRRLFVTDIKHSTFYGVRIIIMKIDFQPSELYI